MASISVEDCAAGRSTRQFTTILCSCENIVVSRTMKELAMSLATLATYGVTAERGFLCPYDAPSVALEGDLGEVRDLALRLPEILPTGSVRAVLDRLTEVSPDLIAELDDVQARMAMVH